MAGPHRPGPRPYWRWERGDTHQSLRSRGTSRYHRETRSGTGRPNRSWPDGANLSLTASVVTDHIFCTTFLIVYVWLFLCVTLMGKQLVVDHRLTLGYSMSLLPVLLRLSGVTIVLRVL